MSENVPRMRKAERETRDTGKTMFINAPEDNPERQELYANNVASMGFVMNLTRAWAWRPEILEEFAALRNRLTEASGLTKREAAVVVCAAASERRDAYCSLAWGRTLAREAGEQAAAAVIGRMSTPALSTRENALAVWVRKVITDPNATTPSDVDALRAAGISDQEIFEATAFAGFRLAFSSINAALGVCPDAEFAGQVPPVVYERVNFGRVAQ
ncbi:MAG: hypothetical protein JNJ55_11285 [Betaproteobacteria bacterium]|nr:hypothetical protein [Betaproteobacteria bacterium]